MSNKIANKGWKKEDIKPGGTIIGATIVKNLDMHTREGDTSK